MKNFTIDNLYDATGIGPNGQEIRKVGLLYTDGADQPHICDCCDEKKPCAHFTDVLGSNVIIMCKACLQLMTETFN